MTAAPTANAAGPVNRDGHNRHTRFKGNEADATTRLAELSSPRAAAFRVDQKATPVVEDRVSGLEGLQIPVPATDGKRAAL